MIKPGEINSIAGRAGVRDTQIEKDYVISWVLYGISENEILKSSLAFKGGTVLKKAYFEDYRFSEDLDFTYIGKEFDSTQIKTHFQKVLDWILEKSRIRLAIKDDFTHTTGNYNFYLTYIGPLGGTGANKDIKVDIASDELMCHSPENRKILHSYTDLSAHETLCYTISEIISEKMRSLMQRTAPRDIYDLWYLFEIHGEDIQDYIHTFMEKARFKKKDPVKFIEELTKKEKTFQIHWKDHLSSQMNEIPDFSEVWRALGKHWKKFEKAIKK